MRKLLSIVLAISLMATALVGCGGSPDTGKPDAGNTQAREDIIIAQSGEPASLDPHNCYELTAMRIYMNMFDGLLKADTDGKLHPALAKEWSISEDGLVYTFKLREDVQFHNGEAFSAKDVKYSFERAMASAYCLEATEPMDKVEIVDDYTIKVTLKYPYGPQINFFATTYLTIVNEKAVTEKGADFSINPAGAGTGAYQFSEWQKGVAVTMVANENYFEGVPAIKKVTYKNIPEASSGAIAVESGNVDIFLQPSTVDVPNLKLNDQLAIYEAESYYCEYVALNVKAAPFDKVEVRQAFALAVDKEELIIAAVDGIGGKETGTIVSPRSFGHNSSIKNYEYNVEKAKALLAKAGLPNGFSCKITTTDGARKKVAEVYQAALSEIGVKAEVVVLESGAYYDDAAKGNGQIYVGGMTALPADGDPIIYSCLATQAIGVTNYSNYSSAALDKLMTEERSSTDPAVREKALKDIQQIIYDEVPLIPSYFRVTINVGNKNIKGLKVEAHNLFYVNELSW